MFVIEYKRLQAFTNEYNTEFKLLYMQNKLI